MGEGIGEKIEREVGGVLVRRKKVFRLSVLTVNIIEEKKEDCNVFLV